MVAQAHMFLNSLHENLKGSSGEGDKEKQPFDPTGKSAMQLLALRSEQLNLNNLIKLGNVMTTMQASAAIQSVSSNGLLESGPNSQGPRPSLLGAGTGSGGPNQPLLGGGGGNQGLLGSGGGPSLLGGTGSSAVLGGGGGQPLLGGGNKPLLGGVGAPMLGNNSGGPGGNQPMLGGSGGPGSGLLGMGPGGPGGSGGLLGAGGPNGAPGPRMGGPASGTDGLLGKPRPPGMGLLGSGGPQGSGIGAGAGSLGGLLGSMAAAGNKPNSLLGNKPNQPGGAGPMMANKPALLMGNKPNPMMNMGNSGGGPSGGGLLPLPMTGNSKSGAGANMGNKNSLLGEPPEDKSPAAMLMKSLHGLIVQQLQGRAPEVNQGNQGAGSNTGAQVQGGMGQGNAGFNFGGMMMGAGNQGLSGAGGQAGPRQTSLLGEPPSYQSTNKDLASGGGSFDQGYWGQPPKSTAGSKTGQGQFNTTGSMGTFGNNTGLGTSSGAMGAGTSGSMGGTGYGGYDDYSVSSISFCLSIFMCKSR